MILQKQCWCLENSSALFDFPLHDLLSQSLVYSECYQSHRSHVFWINKFLPLLLINYHSFLSKLREEGENVWLHHVGQWCTQHTSWLVEEVFDEQGIVAFWIVIFESMWLLFTGETESYILCNNPHSLKKMKNITEREILVVFQDELQYVMKYIHAQVSCGEEKKKLPCPGT